MIEQGLLQKLTTDAGVSALVGTQVYWILAPKGAAVPYIVGSRTATGDTHTVDGDIKLRGGLFQVDCFASGAGNIGYYASRAIAKAVRDSLEGYKGTLPDADSTAVNAVFVQKDWDMPYQEGAKGFVYRALLEFRVWYVEP